MVHAQSLGQMRGRRQSRRMQIAPGCALPSLGPGSRALAEFGRRQPRPQPEGADEALVVEKAAGLRDALDGPAGAQQQGHGTLAPHLVLERDRKSTRLNSSHLVISYAVFCLK